MASEKVEDPAHAVLGLRRSTHHGKVGVMGPARVPDVLDLLAELFEADEELVGLPRRAAQVAVAHIKEYGCPHIRHKRYR